MLIAVIPDTRKAKQNGNFPLRLRISRRKDRFYFPIGIDCSIDDYNRATAAKPRTDVKELRIKIDAIVKVAEKIIDEMPSFTTELFRQKFYNVPSSTDNLFSLFERVITEIRKEGRIGTANAYQDAYRSFHAFHNGTLKEHLESRTQGKSKPTLKQSILLFENITPQWLKRYEREIMGIGNSITTVAIRMRALRVILNRAITEKFIKPELYPFKQRESDKNLYQIPKANNAKRALSAEQITAVMNAPNLTPSEMQSRDLWLFSMLCNGINFTDMLRLRYSDIIREGTITIVRFCRQKTINKRNQTQITIALPPELWHYIESIIQRHGNPHGHSLIFPFIDQCKNPVEINTKIAYLIRSTNKHLKSVAQKCGIDLKISTYHARHSFASALKRSGAPVAMISDSLGHSNTATTEQYLSGFEQKQTADAVGKAFNFFSIST